MIGRKYDEEDWVYVSSRSSTEEVLDDLRASIERWEAIGAYLRMFDDNTDDPYAGYAVVCIEGEAYELQGAGYEHRCNLVRLPISDRLCL